MLEKVLVPLDGSELADRILPAIDRLVGADPAKLEVMLVRVLPPREGSHVTALQTLDDARKHLEGIADRLMARGAQVRYEIFESGDPATRILWLARTWQPSLIALTTHARSGLARLFLGSIAESVVRGAPCPVLVASPRAFEAPPSGRVTKILVPLDLSEASTRVLPFVHEIAKRHDSEVILFQALAIYPPEMSFALDATASEAESFLEPLRWRLDGIATRTKVVLGAAADAIVEAAREEHVDLVAMTTHGRSGIARFIWGSVAEHVLREVGSPLLVLRTSDVATPTAPAEA